MTIAGKAVLVTGANRGIGRALVTEANRGVKRVYAGTRQPLTHPDGRGTPLTLDVTNPAQIQAVAEPVEALDVLINNAGPLSGFGRIVYLAGVLPAPSKTLFELLPPGVEDLMRQSADADGDGWRIPVMSDEMIDGSFGGHGLSPADRAWLRARAVGQPLNTYTDPAPDDLNAVTAIPRTYVVCAGDPGDPVVTPAHRAGRSTPWPAGPGR
jgi:short chain dehydrogenase